MTTQQHTGNARATTPALATTPPKPSFSGLVGLLSGIKNKYRVKHCARRLQRLENAMEAMSLQLQYRGKFGAEDDLTGVFNPTQWLELFHHMLRLHLDFDAFADWY
ncbi:MAG: hypothetical protein QXT73_08615 [Candidatus Methanomethylicaceae archaeon]